MSLLLTLTSCGTIKSEGNLPGLYQLGSGEKKIVLKLRRDHRFLETISTPRIGIVERSGRWSWSEGAVEFDLLWIPKEFAPPSIIEADSKSSDSDTKFTQPGHWICSPQTEFGVVVFEVFPDDGPDFRMVQQW